MKFSCDRCKTRYSIADERVRGKILKIRCKNCSAVITVRESSGAAAEPPAGPQAPQAPARARSALRSAFDAEINQPAEPSASDSFAAPAHIEEEWYLSVEGDQSGPFSLEQAQDWVALRSPDDELYCWSEGFDDWLSVERVAHFRGLRQRPGTVPAPAAPRAPTAPPPVPAAALDRGSSRPQPRPPEPEPEPENLFAAALARADARKRTEQDAPPSKSNGQPDSRAAAPADAADEDLDLDIGEASRVVKLADIMAPAAGAGRDPDDDALPGVGGAELGRGTGRDRAVDDESRPSLSEGVLAGARPEILRDEPRRARGPAWLLPVLLGSGAVALVLGGILLYMALSGDEGDDSGRLAGGLSDQRLAELGYRFEDPKADVAPSGGGEAEASDVDEQTSGGGKTRVRRNGSDRGGRSGQSRGGNTGGGTDIQKAPFGGGDDAPANPDLDPLRPEDVIRVSHSQSMGTKRCYERSLRKDPLLEIRNMKVQLTVEPSGVVSDVDLGEHEDSYLGQCLKARIRKWPFRKSEDGITTEIRVVFEQR